ncbi:PREDICTED: uncharacterized protein LOC105987072 [Dipodomys ordii]|uniref:10 kDa heat shock protein, mitochondrial n=1 Tax=Dipodomys ordii TaxID=10020 RepID=A0A1S3FCA8_DIPOR|nr:PREDICTED: uncharacterized protein LOC105987072 [Dipodomys ordii]
MWKPSGSVSTVLTIIVFLAPWSAEAVLIAISEWTGADLLPVYVLGLFQETERRPTNRKSIFQNSISPSLFPKLISAILKMTKNELKPFPSVGVRAESKWRPRRVIAGQAFRKFIPLFDRVLVERSAAKTVTKGGIMLPEKSQGKVLQATVVAVGSGSKGKGGEIRPVSVKVSDKVLLPEYGGTKVVLDDKDYFLFRDGDILGKYVE